jgi:hypothetical protein
MGATREQKDTQSNTGQRRQQAIVYYSINQPTKAIVQEQTSIRKKAWSSQGRRRTRHKNKKDSANVVMPSQLELAKRYNIKSCRCGNLTAINHHIKERIQMKHDQVCSLWGASIHEVHGLSRETSTALLSVHGTQQGKKMLPQLPQRLLLWDGMSRFSTTPRKAKIGKRKSEWTPPSY